MVQRGKEVVQNIFRNLESRFPVASNNIREALKRVNTRGGGANDETLRTLTAFSAETKSRVINALGEKRFNRASLEDALTNLNAFIETHHLSILLVQFPTFSPKMLREEVGKVLVDQIDRSGSGYLDKRELGLKTFQADIKHRLSKIEDVAILESHRAHPDEYLQSVGPEMYLPGDNGHLLNPNNPNSIHFIKAETAKRIIEIADVEAKKFAIPLEVQLLREHGARAMTLPTPPAKGWEIMDQATALARDHFSSFATDSDIFVQEGSRRTLDNFSRFQMYTEMLLRAPVPTETESDPASDRVTEIWITDLADKFAKTYIADVMLRLTNEYGGMYRRSESIGEKRENFENDVQQAVADMESEMRAIGFSEVDIRYHTEQLTPKAYGEILQLR